MSGVEHDDLYAVHQDGFHRGIAAGEPADQIGKPHKGCRENGKKRLADVVFRIGQGQKGVVVHKQQGRVAGVDGTADDAVGEIGFVKRLCLGKGKYHPSNGAHRQQTIQNPFKRSDIPEYPGIGKQLHQLPKECQHPEISKAYAYHRCRNAQKMDDAQQHGEPFCERKGLGRDGPTAVKCDLFPPADANGTEDGNQPQGEGILLFPIQKGRNLGGNEHRCQKSNGHTQEKSQIEAGIQEKNTQCGDGEKPVASEVRQDL